MAVKRSTPEKVSIITPTYNREKFLRNAYENFARQDYPSVEWLVLDDSPKPSRYLSKVKDPRVRYFHSAKKLSIGEKRNRLISKSDGTIIAHFDDDDFYATDYLSTMVGHMKAKRLDFVKLSGWYLYSVNQKILGFWDRERAEGFHYVVDGEPKPKVAFFTSDSPFANYVGAFAYGFTYVFRKSVWTKFKFMDVNHDEDTPFARKAAQRFRCGYFTDKKGISCHIMHGGNTSSCFPQWILPGFLAKTIFEPAMSSYFGDPKRWAAPNPHLDINLKF